MITSTNRPSTRIATTTPIAMKTTGELPPDDDEDGGDDDGGDEAVIVCVGDIYGGCCIHCACKVGGRLIHCFGIRVTCKRNIGGRHTGMCAERTYTTCNDR